MSNSHTKFGWILFNGLGRDSEMEAQTDGHTFWYLPRALGVGKNKFCCCIPIHVSNSHTKFGWISSNGLGEDSLTVEGRTEAIAIYNGIIVTPL